jgi:hypothetical protein
MMKLMTRDQIKKGRRKKNKAKKRFAGQNLKAEFPWKNWPYFIKATVASIGSADCFDAIIYATRIAVLAREASPLQIGLKLPHQSEWWPEYEAFGCHLIYTLVDKFQADSKSSCSVFLKHLGKALDNLKQQGSTHEPDSVFMSYERLRSGRLLPPTSTEVEKVFSKHKGRENYSDATSGVRKKLTCCSLHLTKHNAIIKFRSALKTTRTANGRATQIVQTKYLHQLSPLEWDLADLYEALIWKFCPQEILGVSIVKKRLFYSMKDAAGFHNEDRNKLAETCNHVCRLIESIYHRGFEMLGDIETSLGTVSAPCRKKAQTTFTAFFQSGGFSEIPVEIVRQFYHFLEQTAAQEAMERWVNRNSSTGI